MGEGRKWPTWPQTFYPLRLPKTFRHENTGYNAAALENEGEPIDLVPADLARELATAMRGAVGDLDPRYDNPNWKRQARERLETALTRYEREVGS